VSDERPTGWEEADRWFSDDAGGGGGEEGPPPVPRCEVCGAELEPDQTYCLECGAPTPLAPRLRRGGRTAALLAGAMVVLGLGAGALAYAVASDDDEGGGGSTTPTAVTAPTATAPIVPPPVTGPLPPDTSFTTPTAPTAPAGTTGTVTGFPTVTGPTPTAPATTDTTPTETEPAPIPTPEPDPDTGSSDWPAGETAWTAVLSSVRSESDARAAKSRLAGTGEPAGVLFSSDYPGLRPGYWVLFSGSFPQRAEAESHALGLSADWPGAYARRIEG
jgi:SPOR domain